MKRFFIYALMLFLLAGGHNFAQEEKSKDQSVVESAESNGNSTQEDSGSKKGSDAVQYHKVQGLETWRYDLDISDYPAGKYNIIIRGTDLAGNEYIEGPFDVLIDPESDKPVVNISNPEPGMRVGGKLNIVGTCVDDETVEKVELRINDGEYSDAQGTEFWSYSLDVEELQDGEYTISARGIDENGTVGDVYSVSFILDKNRPVNQVTSFENGALLNGKVRLEGIVRDHNGIGSLELSTDGGENFEEIKIKSKKGEAEAFFDIKLDTRELEDGAQIYWFRSTDRMGSSAVSAFLFFVDNKAPELEILYPTEDMQANGRFRVVGRVQDEVGIDVLTFQKGKEEPREIPLRIGDPYWFQDFEYTDEEKMDIRFTVTDTTGNSSDYRLRLELDSEGDRPVLDLISPKKEERTSRNILSGYVQDDDEVKEIVYSIDGNSPASVPAHYTYKIPLQNLSPGEHDLEIHAVDINGVAGPTLERTFYYTAPAPEISFASLSPIDGEKKEAIVPGMRVDVTKYEAIEGRVQAANEVESAVLRIQGGEAEKLSLKKTDTPEETVFSVPLEDLQDGFTEVSVEIKDQAGQKSEKSLYVMLTGLELLPEDNKLYYADARFHPAGKPDAPIVLQPGEAIHFLYNGTRIRDALLAQEEPFLKLEVEGNILILRAESEGYSDSCTIEVSSSSGKKINIGPFEVGVDANPPELHVDQALDDSLVGDSFEISGTAADTNGIVNLSYAVNGENATPIELQEDGAFSTSVSLEKLEDGGFELVLMAEDRFGYSTEKRFLLRKDTTAPSMTQLAPIADLEANGKITFTGITNDFTPLKSLEFSSDGENFIPLKELNYPAHPIDLTLYEEESTTYVFRITDKAGNSTLFSPRIDIDKSGDQPVVEIQIPEENALLQNDFTVSGMAFDDDEIDRLLYRIDETEFKQIEGANNFQILVSLAAISDNRHTLEVKAVDVGGVESETAVLHFNVSKSEPLSSMNAPSIESTVRGVVEISGESSDANGIESVLVSYDNGNTFNQTELISNAPQEKAASEAEQELEAAENSESSEDEVAATETTETELQESVQWRYELDTALIADGTHSILVKAVDAHGVEGLYTSLINIDNTPPAIDLNGVFDGMNVAESLELKGRVTDNIQLQSVSLKIEELRFAADGDAPKTESIQLPQQEILLENIDISQFSAGWINLRVTAEDRAGNSSSVSRNIKKIERKTFSTISLYTPALGEALSGVCVVQGKIDSIVPVKQAAVYIDGFPVGKVSLKDSGYFETEILPEDIDNGANTLAVEAELEDGSTLRTAEREFIYNEHGPWVEIGNFSAGDFASDRPWLTGTAGYSYRVPDLSEKELKNFHKQYEVDSVEVSLDNGRTFSPAKGEEEWKYRIETQELPHGELGILVRARFNNGDVAVSKTRLVVDDTPPRIEMLAPGEGMRFNDLIHISGTGSDDSGLMYVEVAIREGGKSKYQVPSFIQGLYIDMHFLGATYGEFGAGLTFFDDNVKLQVHMGLAPPGRFTGMVMGVKLLANLAVFPFEYFFGYDWSSFSSSLAVGATFNYFSMSEDEISFSNEGLVLGALLGQIELLKIENDDRKMFSSFSIYTEGQLWFISSDVSGGIEPRIAFGLRTDVF